MYPEAYRKERSRNKVLISKKEDAPFEICQIEEISVDDWVEGSMVDSSKVKLKVRQFLRPAATKREGANMLCPHFLYYSDKSTGNIFFQQLVLYLRVHFFYFSIPHQSKQHPRHCLCCFFDQHPQRHACLGDAGQQPLLVHEQVQHEKGSYGRSSCACQENAW